MTRPPLPPRTWGDLAAQEERRRLSALARAREAANGRGILALGPELTESFAACQTDLERQVWRVVVARDIARELNGRAPTAAESALLARFDLAVAQ